MAAGVEVADARSGVGRGEAAAIGMLAFAIVVWGCIGRVLAEASPYAQPLSLTMLRAVPTALLLLAALPILRYRLPSTREGWVWTSITGLLMVTWFLGALTESIVRAGPGIALVLLSTSPFFIAIGERVVFGRRIARLPLAGMVVGLGGIVLVASSQLDASGDAGETAIGMALAISAAIAWAAGTIMVKELITRRPDTDLVGLTAGQYVVGGAVLLVLAFAVEGTGSIEWSSGTLWLCIAYISIIGSAIATIAYFGCLRTLDPATATSWMFLSPVVTVLLELVLGNAPDALVLLGMLVTIAGVAIVSAAPRISAARS